MDWEAREMRVSRKGAKFVAGWEGFSATPYRDAVGVLTIGYGTTSADRPIPSHVSKFTARRWLREALNGAYLNPIRALNLNLRQCEIDALAAAVYNLGPGLLEPSTGIGSRLRSHEGKTYTRRRRIYAEELPKWDMAGGQHLAGLTKRREAEVRLANHGDYSGRP